MIGPIVRPWDPASLARALPRPAGAPDRELEPYGRPASSFICGFCSLDLLECERRLGITGAIGGRLQCWRIERTLMQGYRLTCGSRLGFCRSNAGEVALGDRR